MRDPTATRERRPDRDGRTRRPGCRRAPRDLRRRGCQPDDPRATLPGSRRRGARRFGYGPRDLVVSRRGVRRGARRPGQAAGREQRPGRDRSHRIDGAACSRQWRPARVAVLELRGSEPRRQRHLRPPGRRVRPTGPRSHACDIGELCVRHRRHSEGDRPRPGSSVPPDRDSPPTDDPHGRAGHRSDRRHLELAGAGQELDIREATNHRRPEGQPSRDHRHGRHRHGRSRRATSAHGRRAAASR